MLNPARMQLSAEYVPKEVWRDLDKKGVDPDLFLVFLKEPDPDKWPAELKPLRDWLDKNAPEELWP